MALAKACGAFCSHRCSPLADDSDPSTRAILHDRISRYLGTAESLLLLVLTWIVGGIQVFEAQRTNGRYLGDVLTGFCPVEVGRIAGQNDGATDRICLDLVAVELIAQTDVENAGHHRVDSVLRVPAWHH